MLVVLVTIWLPRFVLLESELRFWGGWGFFFLAYWICRFFYFFAIYYFFSFYFYFSSCWACAIFYASSTFCLIMSSICASISNPGSSLAFWFPSGPWGYWPLHLAVNSSILKREGIFFSSLSKYVIFKPVWVYTSSVTTAICLRVLSFFTALERPPNLLILPINSWISFSLFSACTKYLTISPRCEWSTYAMTGLRLFMNCCT